MAVFLYLSSQVNASRQRCAGEWKQPQGWGDACDQQHCSRSPKVSLTLAVLQGSFFHTSEQLPANFMGQFL